MMELLLNHKRIEIQITARLVGAPPRYSINGPEVSEFLRKRMGEFLLLSRSKVRETGIPPLVRGNRGNSCASNSMSNARNIIT